MAEDTTDHDTVTVAFDDRPLREQTMDSVLANRAAALPDENFVRYGPEERDVTFREMNDSADAIGRSLRDLDVGRGDKVSVLMRHPLATLFAMFGIHKAGGVYCPINFEYKGQALSYQLNDTGPTVLVVEDRYVDRLNAIVDDLAALPHVVVYDTGADAEDGSLDSAFDRSAFEALYEAETTAPDVTSRWDDEASIIYTSGTTGKPKGVVLPHRWIFGNYTNLFGQLLGPEDVTHTSLPLYHVGGVYADVTSALVSGSTVGLWDRFSPEAFWDRVAKYGATKTILLSVMIPWLMGQDEREDDHRNTLKMVHMQPLPENHAAIAERFGFPFVTAGFGQTESGNPLAGMIHVDAGAERMPDDLLAGTPPEEILAVADRLDVPVVDGVSGQRYMGKPLSPIVEAAILDERDEKLPPGEVGELAFRSKAPGLLLAEYHGKPDRTVEAFSNLWFHTGDAAYRDEDGNYFFVDRKGDVIRRRGENISSIQVQDVVNGHDAVAQAAVFPVPAEEGGEDEVGAAVVPVDRDAFSREALREDIAAELPEFMLPDHLAVVDEIPTTETNKMEKYKLRQQVLDELT